MLEKRHVLAEGELETGKANLLPFQSFSFRNSIQKENSNYGNKFSSIFGIFLIFSLKLQKFLSPSLGLSPFIVCESNKSARRIKCLFHASDIHFPSSNEHSKMTFLE